MKHAIKNTFFLLITLLLIILSISCAQLSMPHSIAPGRQPETPAPPTATPPAAPQYLRGEAYGNNGLISVTLVMTDDRILAVNVEAPHETANNAHMAIEAITQGIVQGQTLMVDAIAGATYTSKAVISAAQRALENEGMDADLFLRPIHTADYNQELDNVSADVIVVGGGLAGMSAALRAVEEGAQVLLYERSGQLGGAARYATGYIRGTGFHLQETFGAAKDTPEKFYKDMLQLAGGEKSVNSALVNYYSMQSGAAIDFLAAHGALFKDTPGPDMDGALRGFRLAQGLHGGISIVEGLVEAIEAHVSAGNLTVHLFTEVTELSMEYDVVKGVRVVDHRGNTGTAFAKSTVLATGGFSSDEERLQHLFTNVARGGISTADGVGYRLLEQAGAAFHNMQSHPIAGGALPVNGFHSNVYLNIRYQGVLFVDQTGSRVFDETQTNAKVLSDAWRNAPDNTLYAILSEHLLEQSTPLLSTGNAFIPTQDTQWAQFEALIGEGNVIFKAATLMELAQKAGIDSAALQDTIARYNAYAQKGKDRDFGRTEGLVPFTDGPYYAIKTIPYALQSAGGPVVNEKMQVLSAKRAVIPGLYAAGDLLGSASISGDAYLPGTGLGGAATFGIGAGYHAARRALINKGNP